MSGSINYINVVTEIAVLMLYVFIGYILKRLKLLSESGIADISRLVVNVAMPSLVISSLNIEYKQEYVWNMLAIALAAFVFLSFVSIFSGIAVKAFPGNINEKKSMNYCMIFGNISFLGYPICYALFGQVGMLYNSVYLAVQNVFQWTVGVNIYRQRKLALSNLKNLINPGIIAVTIGLAMFFTGVRPPVVIERVITGVGAVSIPLALIVIGATLHGYKILEIAADRGIQLVVLFKMLVYPTVFAAAIYFAPLDYVIKSILVIAAAEPIQASAAVFSRNFGGDSVIAAKSAFMGTILCIVTIPLFLLFINL